MLNTRIEVMRSIATPLIQSEKLVDAAIAELTTILTAGIVGRERAKLPLEAGQAGLDAVHATIRHLLDGRKALHAAHADFRQVKDAMGLSRVAASDDPGYGDKGDTPREYWAAADAPMVTRLAA